MARDKGDLCYKVMADLNPSTDSTNERPVWNGLSHSCMPHEVEDAGSYRPTENHPVHLGDELGDQKQYRVIDKLGMGRDSLIWLCLVHNSNPTRYVAVKIRAAYFSGHKLRREQDTIRRLREIAKSDPVIARYCSLPIDQFQIKDGPNGTHQCYVYPACGPSLEGVEKTINGDPLQFLRNAAYQTAETVAALHRHGICHGDLRATKVLLRDTGLNGMSEQEAVDYLDEPEIEPILAAKGYPGPAPHAPNYVVVPVDWYKDNTRLASQDIYLNSFKDCFLMSDPPQSSNYMVAHCPPEVILGDKPASSAASDIWALACTLYEIRIGWWLFSDNCADYIVQFMEPILESLGEPLPEPWWSTTFKDRRDWYPDEPDEQGRLDIAPNPFYPRDAHLEGRLPFLVSQQHHDLERADGRSWQATIPEEEEDLFVDLLRQMLQYDPKKRPTAEQVLQHPWFSYRLKEQ